MKKDRVFDIFDYINTDSKTVDLREVICEMFNHISERGVLVDWIHRVDNMDMEIPIDDLAVEFWDLKGTIGSEERKEIIEKAVDLVDTNIEAIKKLAGIGLENMDGKDAGSNPWSFINERPDSLKYDYEETDRTSFDIEVLDLANAKARGLIDDLPDGSDNSKYLLRYEELKNDDDRRALIRDRLVQREKFAIDHVGPGAMAYELVRRAERLYMVYRDDSDMLKRFTEREEKFFAEALIIHRMSGFVFRSSLKEAEWAIEIQKDYPFMKRDITREEDNLYYMFGFDFGKGWSEIIRETCEKITERYAEDGISSEEIDLVPTQLKEKYGTLRWYYGFLDERAGISALDFAKSGISIRFRPGRDEVDDKTKKLREDIEKIIDEAEEKSATVCELCGAPGVPRNDGRSWILTLCDSCHKKRSGVE